MRSSSLSAKFQRLSTALNGAKVPPEVSSLKKITGIPRQIENTLGEADFLRLESLFSRRGRTFSYDRYCSRFITSDAQSPELREFSTLLLPKVREIFQNNSLIPTYTFFHTMRALLRISKNMWIRMRAPILWTCVFIK